MSGWALVRERARIADTVVAAVAVMLAAACLVPLFIDLRWVLPAVTVVVVISVLGGVSRGLGMPIPFVPVVQALGLVLTVTALFAASEAWARVVPTTEAWDVLRGLLQGGLLDAQNYMAPVPTFPGLVLLAVGGVGLVALSTDTLFVSVRAPLLAGLPLLAMYLAVALTLRDGAPWWAFPLPAAGWLLILAADQRDSIRRWGGLATTTRVRGLSTGARRTGLVAIALASIIAVVLPMRGSMPWDTGGGSGTGAGTASGPVILDPLVSMRRSLIQANDTEVLTYETQAENPSYLRVSVLETFDGETWRAREGLETGREAGVALPANVLNAFVAVNDSNRVRGGDSYNYDITVTSLQNTFLPLPYPVSQIDDLDGLGTDWSLDPSTGVAFSTDTAATGRSYRVAALDPRIQSGQLRDAAAAKGDFWPQLNLPGGMTPRIRELAREITAIAETPYDKAVALQRWFARDGGFTYSTDVPSGTNADYIAEFLEQRVGYCEQFAGAMAIMARSLGIPSRVVVGFTQGTQDEDGVWRVTVRDAHAWPELWFEGVGWARFEPTPRSGATVFTPEYARAADGDFPLGAEEPRGLTRGLLDGEGFDPVDVDRTPGLSLPLGPIALLTLLVTGLLLALPMARRLVRRRRRLHARRYGAVVDGAWAEVGDLAIDYGQPWSEFSTPRQAAERLSRGMAEPSAAALRRLRQEVEQVRYAPAGETHGSMERAEAVRADVRIVQRELRDRVRWQTRVTAYCWPSSERRRQRSSMRSMKPEDAPGAAGFAGAAGASSAGRAPKAE